MEGYRKYVTIEVVVSIFMSTLMNCIMTFVIFRAIPTVPVWGTSGAVFDAVPTAFMTVLMSSIMPGWLTARRARANALSFDKTHAARLPGNVLVRALLLAVAGALVVALLASALASLSGAAIVAFWTLILWKILLSFLIPLCVTPIAIRESLANRGPKSRALP